MTDTVPMATIIEAITNKTLDYALLLAAIGTLSMAFIELIKGLTAFRRHFHRREVVRWMPNQDCRLELLALAAGGKQNADVLFDQPTERMLGQIQSAANLSLEYPERYPNTYTFFTREDLHFLTLAEQEKPDMTSDSELWAKFATHMARKGFMADEAQQETESRAAQQARVRLGNLLLVFRPVELTSATDEKARPDQTARKPWGVAACRYGCVSGTPDSALELIIRGSTRCT